MPPARLAALAAAIDRLTAGVGRAVMWCVLAMVGIEVAVVLMRSVFGLGSIWLTEAVV